MRIFKKICGTFCLVEALVGLGMLFTGKFKEHIFIGVFVCALFGFLSFLLLKPKHKAVLINVFLTISAIVWLTYCLTGILNNYKHYALLDYIIVFFITLLPFVIYFIVKWRGKKQDESSKHEKSSYQLDTPQETIEEMKTDIDYSATSPCAPDNEDDEDYLDRIWRELEEEDEKELTPWSDKKKYEEWRKNKYYELATDGEVDEFGSPENVYDENKPIIYINQNDTYIHSGNMITRADGQVITDEEIPYLIELGYRDVVRKAQHRAKISEMVTELEFQFMQEHGVESQKRCDKFEELSRLAYEESDINKRILLLQQALVAFDNAKQWHYNYSKGAKLYFQEFWEQLCYSPNVRFNWRDSVKKGLDYQLQIRDEIIPWILEKAQDGFVQTEIYKEFPENSKANLRRIIDDLSEQHIVIKTKKGNSYFITNYSS